MLQPHFYWLFPHFGYCIGNRGQGKLILRSRQPALNIGRFIMQWTAPAFEEVCLNCEINSYVSAKL